MPVGDLMKRGALSIGESRITSAMVLVFLLTLGFPGCITSNEGYPGKVSANRNSASVNRIVNSLDMENYVTSVNALESRITRYRRSESYVAAAHWAREYAYNLGYVNARLQVYKVTDDARSLNVIIKKPGYGPEERRELLIVCAHLDSRNSTDNNYAPGADDNASGSAAVLEIARVFAKIPTYHDIYFVLFGSEEFARRGSTVFVQSYLSDADKNRLMLALNIDMIGYLSKGLDGNDVEPAVTLEGSGIDPTIQKELIRAGKTYTDLKIVVNPLRTNSDHLSFTRAGLPAILTMEGSGPLTTNPHIHSQHDTVDKMSFDLAESILRMNTAFVATVTAHP